MDSTKQWIRDHLGVLVVTLLLLLGSPVLTDIVPNKRVPTLSKAILIGGSLALAGIAAWGDLSRLSAQRKLSASREDWEREHTEQLTAVSRRAKLLQRETEELGEALSEVRTTLRTATTQEERSEARKNCIRAVLKALCRTLEADLRIPPDDPLKAIYFKATLFEFEPGGEGQGVLRRTYWHYPDTIQPRTLKWDVKDDSNSGAVQAYLRRQEVAMPSVAEAARVGAVWKDSRPQQHQEYADSSMVCVPVWAESPPGTLGPSAVRGIVTVDTNQVDYFLPSENEKAFRAQVFGPSLGLIRLVYVLTEE